MKEIKDAGKATFPIKWSARGNYHSSARAAGYKAFRAHIKTEHADALKNKEWAAIKTAALTWLEDKYRNEWTTSNTNENYYTYWGNYWDRTNRGS